MVLVSFTDSGCLVCQQDFLLRFEERGAFPERPAGEDQGSKFDA
jgi:hypothetical protein